MPSYARVLFVLALSILIVACSTDPDLPPAPVLTPTPSPSPTQTSTPTPEPISTLPASFGSDPFSQGMIARRNGDYARAVAAFQATLNMNPGADQTREAQFRLGEAYWLNHDDVHAITALQAYLQANTNGTHVPEVHYFLSDAFRSRKDYASSLSELQIYRGLSPTLVGDTDAGIGDLFVLSGDTAQGLAAYDRALQDTTLAAAARISILTRAADVHSGRGEPARAAARDDAALAVASDARTRADLDWQAGNSYAAAGQLEQATARWQDAVSRYPEQPSAFKALVELLDRDIVVDDFQRGLVDWNAGSYDAAIDAFQRHLKGDSPRAGEAHYYVASAYARKGLYSKAIAEYNLILQSYPKDKRIPDTYMGKASAYAAMGRTDDAVAVYKRFTSAFPQDALADDALWRAAQLLDRAQRYDDANDIYEQLQAKYPSRERAAEALFQAGMDYYRAQNYSTASARWQSITKNYSQSPFYAHALFWLGKAAQRRGQTDSAKNYWKQASALPASYYSRRAADLLAPKTPKPVYDAAFYNMGTDADRADFEKWLAGWAKGTTALGTLDAATRADLRFRRGAELVRLDRTVEARREFAALVASKQDDARALYALALYLRDNNLFSLSLECADRIARAATAAAAPEAPRYLWMLRFPTYYSDLVVAEAKTNQMDPLLYFALIRQESGFNPWAGSSVGARGLGQIMPATGREIAQKLGVSNFSVDQLYQPYISIRFGVWYLAQDMKRFDEPIYALAAYNAGTTRTTKWQRADLDLAVEGIDSSETSLYVDHVYSYWRQYQQVYK